MHILQVSALCFLPAALLAMLLRRWLGFAILTTNVLTSTIAHRLHREPAVDAADRVDEMAILLWVAYNTRVVLQLARVELAMWRTGLIALAVLGAAGSGLLDARRRALPWRSPRRTALHVAMHLSGAVGTFLLLSAAM
mmetsp:Transcript_511/g.1524  ORF Transcript_511/g.1524 Transcript_511/m.1524 type:complete len:138 (-) Transcript_511:579-992(-)